MLSTSDANTRHQHLHAGVPGSPAESAATQQRHQHGVETWGQSLTMICAQGSTMNSKATKLALVAYFLLIHALLAYAIWRPAKVMQWRELPSAYQVEIDRTHQRQLPQLPDGWAVFLGDSITAGLIHNRIEPNSINLGIGGQTSLDLLARMPTYQGIERASAVYLMIGINDIWQGKADQLQTTIPALAKAIPASTPIVWSAIAPTVHEHMNAQARYANELIKQVCGSRGNCRYVDTWPALTGLGTSAFVDGVHLSPAGYKAWSTALGYGYSP